jgi:soluble lytic murein transglycosylase-like protein
VARVAFDALSNAVFGQESSGGKNLIGQQTPYGVPVGAMQTLPSTAAAMAGKLGVPFNPSRLTSKSPEDIAYQRQLGNAYLQEGLQKTGNVRDALRYYYGGPNRKMWGSKTNAYADTVLGKLGGR